MNAINRPCSVANLDPANDNVPYQDEAAFDVRELVDVDEVMEREQLGPNGGVLWAMEEVETNFDWLEQQLEQCGEYSLLYTFRRNSLTQYRGHNCARSSRSTRTYHTSHVFTSNLAASREVRLSGIFQRTTTFEHLD